MSLVDLLPCRPFVLPWWVYKEIIFCEYSFLINVATPVVIFFIYFYVSIFFIHSTYVAIAFVTAALVLLPCRRILVDLCRVAAASIAGCAGSSTTLPRLARFVLDFLYATQQAPGEQVTNNHTWIPWCASCTAAAKLIIHTELINDRQRDPNGRPASRYARTGS
jgi:hypothetical protein